MEEREAARVIVPRRERQSSGNCRSLRVHSRAPLQSLPIRWTSGARSSTFWPQATCSRGPVSASNRFACFVKQDLFTVFKICQLHIILILLILKYFTYSNSWLVCRRWQNALTCSASSRTSARSIADHSSQRCAPLPVVNSCPKRGVRDHYSTVHTLFHTHKCFMLVVLCGPHLWFTPCVARATQGVNTDLDLCMRYFYTREYKFIEYDYLIVDCYL